MSEADLHGYCTVCNGPIPGGVKWTFTGMLFRVHADPDDCVAVLRPEVHREFMRLNPNYRSRERYDREAVKRGAAKMR